MAPEMHLQNTHNYLYEVHCLCMAKVTGVISTGVISTGVLITGVIIAGVVSTGVQELYVKEKSIHD